MTGRSLKPKPIDINGIIVVEKPYPAAIMKELTHPKPEIGAERVSG